MTGWPDPYRILFPFGVAFALWGALVWPLTLAGWLPYPGPTHRALMMQGFELSFVLGFLFTAMPGFTHGPKARPFELVTAAVLMLALGVSAAAGAFVAAAACGAAAMAWAGLALVRRVIAKRVLPPEEFMFVGLGLALGIAGTIWNALLLAGTVLEPTPYFAQRLVSLGMMLSLVLGLGALLVPAFAGIADPLAIPGLARAHERGGRRTLYLVMALLLVAAFGLEASGHAAAGAAMRAGVATIVLLWVWKLPAPSARNDTFSVALRIAGGCVLAGLWLAALAPRHAIAGHHVMFIGGFGLLTMGIATRVVVSHGRHPIILERRLLPAWQVAAVLLAALARAWAEYPPAPRMELLGVSGVVWTLAWIGWMRGALPLIVRVTPAGGLTNITT